MNFTTSKIVDSILIAAAVASVILVNGLVSVSLEQANRSNYAIDFETSSRITLAQSSTIESGMILKLLDLDLAFLEGETLLVPPVNFQNVPLVLGIGITPTFKRFFLPPEDWLLRMWWNCEPNASSVSAVISQREVFDGSGGFKKGIQECYKNLEQHELWVLAERYEAKYAVGYDSQCREANTVYVHVRGSSVVCLIRVRP